MKKWLLALYFVNLAIITYFWWSNSSSLVLGGGSGTLIGLARIAGLLGMYSMVVQDTLASRNPLITVAPAGSSFRRYNGQAGFALITSHVVMIIAGYALAAQLSPFAQLSTFWRVFPFVWSAILIYSLILITVVVSVKAIKRRTGRLAKYLYTANELVIWLLIFHQIRNGGDFLANPIFKIYWIVLILTALANIIFFRFMYGRLRTSWSS